MLGREGCKIEERHRQHHQYDYAPDVSHGKGFHLNVLLLQIQDFIENDANVRGDYSSAIVISADVCSRYHSALSFGEWLFR